MSKIFNLSIVTVEKELYGGQVISLIVPAALGYLGVLADHAPLVANLTSGKIILIDAAGESRTFYSKGKGFLEVLRNNVNVVLNHAVAA